jgi:hypothetical protein
MNCYAIAPAMGLRYATSIPTPGCLADAINRDLFRRQQIMLIGTSNATVSMFGRYPNTILRRVDSAVMVLGAQAMSWRSRSMPGNTSWPKQVRFDVWHRLHMRLLGSFLSLSD